MSRAAWLNLLLAAAVAALGAWAWFKPGKETPAEHALSALAPAGVGAIHIERPGAPPISLQRKADGWRLTAPFSARGDEARVARLLEILGAKTPHRLPATDLARFELDRPQARLTIGQQAFGFGMVSEVTREQYVLTEGGVFAVHPRYGAALPASAADMASLRLLGPAETPTRIETKAFTLAQRDGKWALAPPANDPGQDALLRWVEQWRLATASRVEAQAGGRPLETIRVRTKEGASLALEVLAREPALVIQRPDEKLQYHFRAETARRLFTMPDAGMPGAPAEK